MSANAPALSGAYELLTCEEAARALRLSVSTMERMRLGSGPPFIKLGTGKRARVVYRRSDIEGWLQSMRHQSTSEYNR